MADLVDKKGADDSLGELLAVVDERDVSLLDKPRVPSRIEHRAEEVGEHCVTCLLPEDGYDDITAETINSAPVAEQHVVVLPALVSTVHIEELFVFVKLQRHPGGVRVAIAIVLGQDLLHLLFLAVDIQPVGRLRDKERKEHNEAGEEGLELGD